MRTKTEKLLFKLSLILPISILAISGVLAYLNPTQQVAQTPTATGEVLAAQNTTQLFISADEQTYESSGVISQSIYTPPKIYFDVTNASESGMVKVYKASHTDMLTFLTHDGESNQLNPILDVSNKEQLLEKKLDFTKTDAENKEITLPIGEEKGIWLLDLTYKNLRQQAFLVRSSYGVYTSETERDYLFWAQDFYSGKSLQGVNIKLYALKNTAKETQIRATNEKGISQVEIEDDVDIALTEKDGDYALIPINLTNLNYYDRYQRFYQQNKVTTSFTFTDRPLYKPGDTIYFKSILRDELDRVYSIPSGNVTVKLFSSWPNDKKIFEKAYSISGNGDINGEYKIPDDARTGYYYLTVERKLENDRVETDTVYFNVNYYRKPEYSLELSTPTLELVRGDRDYVSIKARYFSGEPVRNKEIEYKVLSNGYYEYEYAADIKSLDQYLYGYQYGDELESGTVMLDDNGEGKIQINSERHPNDGKPRVFSIEAELDDGSGNPSFDRKNILVRQAEWGIYREQGKYYAKVNEPYDLPLVIKRYKDGKGQQTKLTAKIKHTRWEKYSDSSSKYPRYREVVKQLDDMQLSTDGSGKANLRFTPQNEGSYEITLTGTDDRGNNVHRVFYAYASSQGWTYNTRQSYSAIDVTTDKKDFEPTDTVKAYLSLSDISDRDVLVTVDGAYTDRYQVISVTGSQGTVDIPLSDTDTPNRFIVATTFTKDKRYTQTIDININKKLKNIQVNIIPEHKEVAPGQTIGITVETKDIKGNPVSANVALWGIDKALYELQDSNLGSIFEAFWSNRYHATQTTDSLEGIYAISSEKGGCFTGDTVVLMKDGSAKKISELKKGEIIKTRKNEKDATLVETKINEVRVHEVDGYLIINGTLKITPEHILFVNNEWTEAGNIQVGDTLIRASGQTEKVQSIEWTHTKETVYNLEIEKHHTFFADGYWVHNEKGGGETRGNLKDTAYWNPSVQTDNNGRATVRVKLPDNLTTWVFSAVGATVKTEVGQNTTEIVASKDIIVRPIIPNIVRVGDKIKLSALVYNGTDKEHTFDVNLNYPPGDLRNATQAATLKSEETIQLYWEVDVQRTDKADLTVYAKSRENKDLSDAIKLPLPVRPYQVTIQTSQTATNDHTYDVQIAADTNKKQSEVELILASSLAQNAKSAMSYLITYPYGCTEQTTSRLVPIIIAKKYPTIFSESLKKHEKEIDKMLAEGFKRLKQNQIYDGGWAWWGYGPSDPHVSMYVVEYLLLADQLNLEFDRDMLEAAKRYFTNLKENTMADRIYKTYALSLWDPKTKPIEKEILQKLSIDQLPYAVLANQKLGITSADQNGLTLLYQLGKIQGNTIVWPAGNKDVFGSQFVSNALAARALDNDPQYKAEAAKAVLYISRNKLNQYWGNSFATAQIIRTISEVEEANINNNYSYTVSLDGQQIAQGQVTNNTKNIPIVTIPTDKLKTNSKVAIKKTGEGDLYSTLTFKHVRTDKNLPEQNNGLSIKRTYMSEKGPNYTLAVGDRVTVQLEISGLNQSERYAVIQDELPAGLVPINKAFNNEQLDKNNDNYYNYDYSYDTEYTENGAIISLYALNPNHVVTYQARVVSEGTFTAPPAFVSLMYAPEISATSTSDTITTTQDAIKTYDLPDLSDLGNALDSLTKDPTRVLSIVTYIMTIIICSITLYVHWKQRKKQQ